MRHIIGGDHLPMIEIKKLVEKHLHPLKPVNMWTQSHQCRCGSSEVVVYRKGFYCYRCGRRVLSPDAKIWHPLTFRERYEIAKKQQVITS